MPDVLDIVILFEQVEHFFHVVAVFLLVELLVGLRDHLDLGGVELVALVFERLGDGVDVVGVSVDGEAAFLGLEIGRACVERVHHDGVLVQLLVLVVDDDNALAVERPADAALRAHALAVLIEVVADLRRGALAVVGQCLDDDATPPGP